MQRASIIFALVITASQTARSQSVISLRAGLLTYAEGHFQTTNSKGLPRVGSYHLRAGEQLQTQSGRAELLLAPSVFLRLGDASEVAMNCDKVDDVQVTLQAGSAVVDAVDIPKGERVRVQFRNTVVELHEAGIYRFDAALGELKVFEGRAEVSRIGGKTLLKRGRMLVLEGSAEPIGFDRKSIDRLQHWSAIRSLAVAQSNLKSARSNSGPGWRRVARIWVWSIYMNADAARASLQPATSGF